MKKSHKFSKYDIEVTDEWISKYAQKYVDLLSKPFFGIADLENDPRFKDSGFSSASLLKTLKQATLPKRVTGSGKHQDIYRSDLGELLMVHFFEEGISSVLVKGDAFIIPLKNIADRELCDAPGRGLDAIGYRDNSKNITLLLGEGKVSEEKKNPPQVVDSSSDSIYKTHKRHKDDKDYLVKKLGQYIKKLDTKDAGCLSIVLLAIESGKEDFYDICYGCCLIRDSGCVNDPKDFGKMSSKKDEFDPGEIHFVIPSFKNRSITETVDLFFKKVQELSS